MSHIKDRLSSYHDWMQDIVNRYKLVTARDFLEMIEQLQEDLEQDEKENGWIPVSERLPKEDGRYLVTFKHGIKVCMVGYGSCKRTVLGCPIGHGWYSLEEAQYYADDSIIAWMPLPEPYKEDKKYERPET